MKAAIAPKLTHFPATFCVRLSPVAGCKRAHHFSPPHEVSQPLSRVSRSKDLQNHHRHSLTRSQSASPALRRSISRVISSRPTLGFHHHYGSCVISVHSVQIDWNTVLLKAKQS